MISYSKWKQDKGLAEAVAPSIDQEIEGLVDSAVSKIRDQIEKYVDTHRAGFEQEKSGLSNQISQQQAEKQALIAQVKQLTDDLARAQMPQSPESDKVKNDLANLQKTVEPKPGFFSRVFSKVKDYFNAPSPNDKSNISRGQVLKNRLMGVMPKGRFMKAEWDLAYFNMPNVITRQEIRNILLEVGLNKIELITEAAEINDLHGQIGIILRTMAGQIKDLVEAKHKTAPVEDTPLPKKRSVKVAADGIDTEAVAQFASPRKMIGGVVKKFMPGVDFMVGIKEIARILLGDKFNTRKLNNRIKNGEITDRTKVGDLLKMFE